MLQVIFYYDGTNLVRYKECYRNSLIERGYIEESTDLCKIHSMFAQTGEILKDFSDDIKLEIANLLRKEGAHIELKQKN